MSGGAEQADILSVLSLVKERWKVVSVACYSLTIDRVFVQPRHCLALGHPLFHKQQLFVGQTNAYESFCFPLKYLTCGLDSLGSCLSVQVGLLQYGRSKNSPI